MFDFENWHIPSRMNLKRNVSHFDRNIETTTGRFVSDILSRVELRIANRDKATNERIEPHWLLTCVRLKVRGHVDSARRT